ncbi:BlaI/MecI/CopY family transcriptional regulator [Brevibacterium oceani]|uniref:BlaI/MecI/CopY family transcriptional regulator n=1 Tax=Brevibacterium oceani TaxID=358099 RepID=UPI001B32BE8F|nr:BlaI/MecI/CopY family transcriptional regulator [Brevibacterium oceani]
MKRRNNGELENAVLTALWGQDEPMSVAELQSAVPAPKPAYTTMMTVLTRLEDKGLITRERVSRSLMITPVHSQAATAASEMSRTLRDSTDSREVLMSFIGSLDDDEIEVLRSFVRD